MFEIFSNTPFLIPPYALKPIEYFREKALFCQLIAPGQTEANTRSADGVLLGMGAQSGHITAQSVHQVQTNTAKMHSLLKSNMLALH